MKKYLFILFFLATGNIAHSQQSYQLSAEPERSTPQLKPSMKQLKGPNLRVYYEDFAGALPTGWSVANGTANGNNWRWSNTAPGGQYSTTISALNSTSGSNGFLSLPAGLFNTPFPPGGPVAMDAWVTSPAITIPAMGIVYVRFEQYLRYCCLPSNELVLETSTNGTTWTTYDASGGIGPNTFTANPQVQTINVTNSLANSTTAYLRFRSSGASHYFWMIDDLEILEGDSISLLLENFRPVFSRTDTFNPTYTMIPQNLLQAVEFEVDLRNDGIINQTMVTANLNVYNDSTYLGALGTGLVQSSSKLGGNLAAQARTTIVLDNPPFVNLYDGIIRAETNLSSTLGPGPNPNPLTLSSSFEVTDTIFARDDGSFEGAIGPSTYVGGGQDNDAWGMLYDMLADSGVATSVSIYVSGNTNNVSSSISPRIWPFDDAAPTLATAIGNYIGSSPFSTTITAADLNSWITLPLFPPIVLAADSQFIVGWEQTWGGISANNFTAGRDVSSEASTQAITHFCFLNDPTGQMWISPRNIAGIRLNFGQHLGNRDFVVGSKELKTNSASFNIFPNPARDQVKVMLKGQQQSRVIVRDSKGIIVYEEWVGNRNAIDLYLTKLSKGIYFVTVVSEKGRQTQKLIIY